MNDVTRILSEIEAGRPQAADQLFPLIYDELRNLAAARLAQEKPGQTLQATALVHEAYVRLVDKEQPPAWRSRSHFFAAAAEAMRRILVEKARQKMSLKRGGNRKREEFDVSQHLAPEIREDLVALDDSLRELERSEPDAAQLVKLRYFAGLTLEQAADALGISVRSAYRLWAYAKAWLFEALQD